MPTTAAPASLQATSDCSSWLSPIERVGELAHFDATSNTFKFAIDLLDNPAYKADHCELIDTVTKVTLDGKEYSSYIEAVRQELGLAHLSDHIDATIAGGNNDAVVRYSLKAWDTILQLDAEIVTAGTGYRLSADAVFPLTFAGKPSLKLYTQAFGGPVYGTDGTINGCQCCAGGSVTPAQPANPTHTTTLKPSGPGTATNYHLSGVSVRVDDVDNNGAIMGFTIVSAGNYHGSRDHIQTDSTSINVKTPAGAGLGVGAVFRSPDVGADGIQLYCMNGGTGYEVGDILGMSFHR